MPTKPMMPRLTGQLLIVSQNAGKLREFSVLFKALPVTPISAQALQLADVEETGKSFAANAELKARAGMQATALPALGDDSGLEVAALDGAPGIYSARWAQRNGKRDFGYAMTQLADKLAERNVALYKDCRADSPRARFVCALALALPDNDTVHHFMGTIDGHLVYPPRGTKGFGYDPIFVPQHDQLTFGEMAPAYKDSISHRARAFGQFLHWAQGGAVA